MGREVRKVPRDWKHPKNKDGDYIPMYDGAYRGEYERDINAWIKNYQLWQKGEHPDQKRYPSATADCKYYALWKDDPPVLQGSNPYSWDQKEACCFQLYENVTEGTPMGPVFETLDELQDWLVKSEGYSIEAARSLCDFGILPTFTVQLEKKSAKDNSIKPLSKKKKGRKL